YLHY
ncbi:hypothetical protein ACTA71_011359, partial [Dictyostelium dimigraforme]